MGRGKVRPRERRTGTRDGEWGGGEREMRRESLRARFDSAIWLYRGLIERELAIEGRLRVEGEWIICTRQCNRP